MKTPTTDARCLLLSVALFLAATGCVGTPPPKPAPNDAVRRPDPRASAVAGDELIFIEIHGRKWDGKSDIASKRFEIVDIEAR